MNEDATEVHCILSLAVLGQREVDCSKIAVRLVVLTKCEQMERFDVLPVDKLMSGIQVVEKDTIVSNGDEDYILFSY